MGRIPEGEIERLKREVAVERLAAGRGVELRRHGADLIGRCPFHDDRTPSLVITPQKNLWHCLGACNAGGGPIDWVMKAEGASFRLAVELLREGYAPGARRLGSAPKRGSMAKLGAPLDAAAGDGELLGQVAAYYHRTLEQSPEALAYLEKRGLRNEALIARFQLGFANRTLGYHLEDANRKAGAEARARLQALGVIRASGHEHFNGSLTVPIVDLEDRCLGLYGRKITPRLREGTPEHLYLPGGHRGVWNEAGIAAADGEAILCEALLDAMTFWCAGFENVTASYGVNGFTPDHGAAFARHGIRKVYLAYDRDAAGDAAARALAGELMAKGIECLRVEFPRGLDANEYALKVTPAAKSLGLVLQRAEWLGGAAASRPAAIGLNETPEAAVPAAEPAAAEGTADAAPPDQAAQPTPASSGEPRLESTGAEAWVWAAGGRRWRVRGLGKNAGGEAMKVNLMLTAGAGLHVDVIDLYQARQRQGFARQAAEETGAPEDALRRELGVLLRLLEEARAAAAQPAPEAARPEMSEAARGEALELLRSPDLIERILADFDRCGVVGEETNKLAAYLACTSRLLQRPLAVVVQSSTAAGKSALMDAVVEFMPEEQVARYSALTGQALYYMGSADLKHKILAIAEEEGAAKAAYALKLLQSEGALRIAATGKDPDTGRLTTEEYTVEGPAAILLTTTSAELDEELLNRCLVLGVSEEREQTRAIHERQRAMETLDGLLQAAERRERIERQRNAQRLLEPLAVVNPYARGLDFPDRQTRARRDHAKYLALIRTIALLHQRQRPRKRARGPRGEIDYIEAQPSDIALANRLAREILGRGMAELPPQTRKLLGLLDGMVKARGEREGLRREEVRFSRRQAREFTGWAQTRLQLHLRRLEDLEYLLAHRGARGQGYVYELAYEIDAAGEAALLPGLREVYDANLSGETARLSPPNHPGIGPHPGAVRSAPARASATPFSSLAAQEPNSAPPDAPPHRVVAQAAAAGEAAR